MAGDEYSGQQFFVDVNTRVRDLEERQRIIKDRMLLIGNSFVQDRDKNFKELQELKKTVLQLKADNERMKDMLKRISEQLASTTRKEDLMILQRQFDLFREN